VGKRGRDLSFLSSRPPIFIGVNFARRIGGIFGGVGRARFRSRLDHRLFPPCEILNQVQDDGAPLYTRLA
jgi:hypothetical protein